MKSLIAIALAAGTAGTAGAALVALTPADAAQGCGRGFHRGAYGRCLPNRPGPFVVDRFYHGQGYWDGRRFWHNRRHWHGGWRYY